MGKLHSRIAMLSFAHEMLVDRCCANSVAIRKRELCDLHMRGESDRMLSELSLLMTW